LNVFKHLSYIMAVCYSNVC